MHKPIPSSSVHDIDFLQTLSEISSIVLRTKELDHGLNDIMRLVRKIFIYDNVVLYHQLDEHELEPIYARAIGRGRSSETDLAWGESAANEALSRLEVVTRQEINGDYLKNRMRLRYFIGLPLSKAQKKWGALIFVRYGSPPFDPDHIQLAGLIAIFITQLLERLDLIEQVSNLERELRLKRMQDDFVATISHELRTPLGFIKGYTTTLLRDDTNWDDTLRREFLSIIDEETDRLGELIDNLLDSSRLQSGTLRMEFQPVRLDTILKEVCLRAQSFSNNQNVELHVHNAGVVVNADPTRIAQVFDNLLNNAKKYASGSKVVISLEAEPDQAHITVSDYGPGIPAEHLENIFERFFRVPSDSTSTRGTGLGLYICRQILNAHGGNIMAESTLGEGTTFHIHLPRGQGQSITKT